MFDILRSVTGLLKPDRVCIDGWIFRLHCKTTFIILISFSFIVSSSQYFGDPINCINDDISSSAMDSYCWIHSTYTISRHIKGESGRHFAYPGVMNHFDGGGIIKYHKYYQWVSFILLFQALLFYAPRYVWKSWEGNRIKMLVGNLNVPVLASEEKKTQKDSVMRYLQDNLNCHNFYAFRYFICEVLIFINVSTQIYFMDYFLDGEFSFYSINLFKSMETPDDMMARVFPKLTKCSFQKYGPSGSIQAFDALCILPLNVVNEKIYIFLWFWFIILAVLSGWKLLYRALLLCLPWIRKYMLRTRIRNSSCDKVMHLLNKCSIGDWFIIYQLKQNIDMYSFNEIINGLSVRINDA
ncbi:innexin inx2-like [Contarinia nasturtii]|uniref:innexin inx2-like n=1 Tax=Contarinia nasturtii TaxID=265458 RepID=UPI0012D38253|nr:innexin inx2-like [Contarinia nasturtii]